MHHGGECVEENMERLGLGCAAAPECFLMSY